MQFNDKFGMQDLFMNEELKGLFPQFLKTDSQKNVFSYEWIDKKVTDYIKSVFNGTKTKDGEIEISGKFDDIYKQISAMKGLIENMFDNMPAITKNIRKNTKVFLPFQSIEQMKNISDPVDKMRVMQIIFDNLNYNPDFKSEDRFSNKQFNDNFYKRQDLWLKSVGYYNKRRKKYL